MDFKIKFKSIDQILGLRKRDKKKHKIEDESGIKSKQKESFMSVKNNNSKLSKVEPPILIN